MFSACGTGLVPTKITASNRTGVLSLSGYSWATASQYWGGVYIPRANRGGLRLPNWTSSTLVFAEQCFKSAPTFSDFQYQIVVDNVAYTAVQGTADMTKRLHVVTGMPVNGAGTSTVRIMEPWGTVYGTQGSGVDPQVEGGNVVEVSTPPGYTVAAGTASTLIVTITDSIFGASVSNHVLNVDAAEVMGICGQISLLAWARGWLLADLGDGGRTACGDGITAIQRAQLVVDMAAHCGATLVKVVINLGHNDSANSTATAAQVTTYIQGIINALPTSGSVTYEKHVLTPLPSTSEGTLATYSSHQMANLTGTTSLTDGHNSGFNTSTDFFDGVHLNQTPGVPRGVALMRTPLGL